MKITRKALLGNLSLLALVLLLALGACSKSNRRGNIPDKFNSMTTAEKMEYLMEQMPADSVANFICDAAMGKIYDARIELQEAQLYAYEHYGDDDQIAFAAACKEYEDALPLHEKVKFAKLSAAENPDVFSYELGLGYVGSIREEKKEIKQINEELEALKRECQYDPDFYKRFMKGFKTALELDRHRDLNDKIYLTFITYPDSIK